MTPERKAELEERWQECERLIQAIHAGKVIDGDPRQAVLPKVPEMARARAIA